MKSQLQEIRERVERVIEKAEYVVPQFSFGSNTTVRELKDYLNQENIRKQFQEQLIRTDIPKLLAALEKAIEQRDSWASMIETCDNFGVLERENAEIEAVLRGEK